MIFYADASVIVKRYLREAGSDQVRTLFAEASLAATALVSRAEVSAALAKSVRVGVLTRGDGESALRQFRAHWPDMFRLRVTEAVAARADELAWRHGLRGYDTIHLATALGWGVGLGEAAALATYDHQLWRAAQSEGFLVWPEALAG